MWKHILTATASALVAAVALGGAQLQVGAADSREREEAEARVSVARAVAASDERVGLAVRQVAADEAARALAAQRAAAEAARQAAERAAAERAEAERVEAERVEAERAAAEQAAQQAASAGTARRARPAANAPSSSAAWQTSIVNSGGQGAVDACLGGLTRWLDDIDGKPYYPVHRDCGGAPILDLRLGQLVLIDDGTWVVTDSRDVPRGSTYDAARGLAGQILLQTCYRDDSVMRLVALSAA